jgi:hypothetical protein
VHPEEVKRRGLSAYNSAHPLRVTLGDGKQVLCNRGVRLKLMFDNYNYESEAYVLDMGVNPDCTIILGTPWLASLGDYTCNEHRGTLSFWTQGRLTPQKVTLVSRGQEDIRKQQGLLGEHESSFKQAKAEMQRAKRHGWNVMRLSSPCRMGSSTQKPPL